MAVLRNVRNSVLLAFQNDIIDDEECVLLYDVNSSKIVDYPHWKYDNFHIDALDDSDAGRSSDSTKMIFLF